MSIIEFASKELIIPLAKVLGKAARNHQEELRAIGDEFFDPFILSRLYVEPNCQHYNPADKDEDNHANAEIRGKVFDVLDKFLAGEDVSCTGGNNQLLVLADAGMGKTSLLIMLKLFHWGGNWPAGIKCVLIKLGDDSLERINNLTDRANTVLLLDSLDEDPAAWNRLEQRLIDLLDATKNFRRVVISCRTQFFPEGDKDPFARLGKLEVGGFVCPMFYLSPFSSQQVDEYLEKKFPTTGIKRLLRKQNPNKVKAGEILENMRSLRMRPFLLSNIEYLIENGEANWNDYSVYTALVEQWLNREESKIRDQARKRGRSIDSLPNKEKLWSVCEVVARHLYEKRVRSLTQTEFIAIIRTNPDVEMIDELEHGSKSLLNKHSNGDYRFSHYSIQEFLVVHSWDVNLDASQLTPQMWKFVVASGRLIPCDWIERATPKLRTQMEIDIARHLSKLTKPWLPYDADPTMVILCSEHTIYILNRNSIIKLKERIGILEDMLQNLRYLIKKETDLKGLIILFYNQNVDVMTVAEFDIRTTLEKMLKLSMTSNKRNSEESSVEYLSLHSKGFDNVLIELGILERKISTRLTRQEKQMYTKKTISISGLS